MKYTWIAIAAVLAAAVALLASYAGKAFYYPDNTVYGSPRDNGLDYEETVFSSKDGTKLYGWFVPAKGLDNPKNAKGTVVHFHGNAQNMSAHGSFVYWLAERGFNVFLFDYRGYGNSAGSPERQGVFEDSDSALDYVRSRPDINPDRLLVFGQSLGGTNALAVVGSGNKKGVKAVAIESTFFSYPSIANEKLAGAGLLLNNRYSASEHIAAVSPIPLLLLHGTADQVIPVRHSEQLFQTAKQPKELVTVPDGGHLEIMTERFGNRYQDVLAAFFEQALAAEKQ